MCRKPNVALLQTRLAKYGHHLVSIYCGLRHLLFYSTIFVWSYPLLRLMAPKDFQIGMGWNHQDIFDTEPCGKCSGLLGSILEQRKTSKDAVVQANPAFSVPVRNNTWCLTTPWAFPRRRLFRVGPPAFIFMCERATADECHLSICNIHANGKADVESCLDTDVGFGAEPVADIDMRIGADLQLSTAIIYLL